MHIYNIILLLHWNVNSLWAVRNEAIWEFPYWLYYHFTQRIDCISLKAEAGGTITRRKICGMKSAALGADIPVNLTLSPRAAVNIRFLSLGWRTLFMLQCRFPIAAALGPVVNQSRPLSWNLHTWIMSLAHRSEACSQGLFHLIWLSFLNTAFDGSEK